MLQLNPSIIPAARRPTFEVTTADTEFCLSGIVGDWLATVVDSWLLAFPRANPAIIQMFRDRDRQPTRKLVQWSGEFAGKYLVSALQIWQQTRDERLWALIDEMVHDIIDIQGPDGYLGPFPAEERLIGENWDVWGHYHVMLALLHYFEVTGHRPALGAACKAAGLICRTFGPGQARLVNDGSQGQMNMGLLHVLVLLYRHTGKQQYLDTALWIVQDSDREGASQFMRGVREGKEFYEFTACRWELLHTFQGLAELYWLTGEEQCRQAVTHIWDSIRRLDRHNTGGFSTGEQACGNPYAQGAVETCCTVAWMCLSVDMLRLTGDSTVADELELSLHNGMMGAMHPSGRWWTYDTPMDGMRRAFVDPHSWQAHPGGPELNCCQAHAARGIALLRDWTLMTYDKGIVLNLYCPGSITAILPNRSQITLTQDTSYPIDGQVRISVAPDRPREFALRVRIPAWSARTSLLVNGEPVNAEPGTYCELVRQWQPGDTIELELDMSLRYWGGEQECAGKVSLYRGPILLAYDQRFNPWDPDEVPAVNLADLAPRQLPVDAPYPQPLLMLQVNTVQGQPLTLCDFFSAGAAGNPYRSWLPAQAYDAGCSDPFACPQQS